MVNIDLPDTYIDLDKHGMLKEIQGLPAQLNQAFQISQALPLPENNNFQNIIFAGMGGSAIGADILCSYITPLCKTHVTVQRGYQLPLWAQGKNTLVVCSSHSGNTEETISTFMDAVNKGCTTMAISTGGELQDIAEHRNRLHWKFQHSGQPRAAVGFAFGLLLGLMDRLKLLDDQQSEIDSAVAGMSSLIQKIDANIPVARNLAKRISGQAVDRFVSVFGAEHLEPVARRWKTQINEISKAWAQFEFLPEADHNTLAGVLHPTNLIEKVYSLFLKSNFYHERNQLRFDLTFEEMMVAGLCTDNIVLQSENRLEEVWKMILLGDYISYYMAIAYEVDPTPVEAIENLKTAMK